MFSSATLTPVNPVHPPTPAAAPSLMTTRAIPFLSAYLLLALSGSPASEPSAAGEIAVGAIRWDAWHGRSSEMGRAMEKVIANYRVNLRDLTDFENKQVATLEAALAAERGE